MAERRSASLQINTRAADQAVIVSPMGDIDLTASPALRQELKRVQAGKPQRVIVDLSGVPYMDSSGLATLVEAMQFARRTATRLVLCSLGERVRSIIEIARLDSIFILAPTLDDALKA